MPSLPDGARSQKRNIPCGDPQREELVKPERVSAGLCRGRYETQIRRSERSDVDSLSEALMIEDFAFRRRALSGVMKGFRQFGSAEHVGDALEVTCRQAPSTRLLPFPVAVHAPSRGLLSGLYFLQRWLCRHAVAFRRHWRFLSAEDLELPCRGEADRECRDPIGNHAGRVLGSSPSRKSALGSRGARRAAGSAPQKCPFVL